MVVRERVRGGLPAEVSVVEPPYPRRRAAAQRQAGRADLAKVMDAFSVAVGMVPPRRATPLGKWLSPSVCTEDDLLAPTATLANI